MVQLSNNVSQECGVCLYLQHSRDTQAPSLSSRTTCFLDLGEGVCLGRSLLLLLKGEEARSGDSDGTDAIALLTSRGGACGGDGDGF